MFNGGVKEALRGAFNELLNSRDFEVYMEDFVANEPRGTGCLTEEPVLEGLHPMDMVGLSVCEHCTGIRHDRSDARCINTQFAPK